MINLDDNNYLMATYDMHEAQEESLYQHSLLFPDELNLKINLTYSEALSELDTLSSMPEYRKYFQSILQLAPSKDCPKVLGAWLNKVEGFIRVAFLDEELQRLDEDFSRVSSEQLSGKVINFSIKNPSQGWTKIADFLCCNTNTYGYDQYLHSFTYQSNNLSIALNHIFPLNDTLPHPADILPENAMFPFVTETFQVNQVIDYPIIDKEVLNIINDAEEEDNLHNIEISHSCFYIPYEHIKNAVNLESNLGQHRLIKSATSSRL